MGSSTNILKRDVYADVKVCLSIIVLLLIIQLFCGVIYILINHSIEMNNKEYEELVRTSKKTVVRSGYWSDGGRWCTVNDPCIMNCLEYSRYDLGCGPEEPECSYGHYDWCKDEPTGGQI